MYSIVNVVLLCLFAGFCFELSLTFHICAEMNHRVDPIYACNSVSYVVANAIATFVSICVQQYIYVCCHFHWYINFAAFCRRIHCRSVHLFVICTLIFLDLVRSLHLFTNSRAT